MINKTKECKNCNGYGNLYLQTVTRFDNKKLKGKSLFGEELCSDCGGNALWRK